MIIAVVQALTGRRILRRYVGRHRTRVVTVVSTNSTTQPVIEEAGAI